MPYRCESALYEKQAVDPGRWYRCNNMADKAIVVFRDFAPSGKVGIYICDECYMRGAAKVSAKEA
jgi:hypothetical protein